MMARVQPFALLVLVCVLALASCGPQPAAKADKADPVSTPAAAPGYQKHMVAAGTEPFWRIDISPDGGMVLTDPNQAGGPQKLAAYVAPLAAAKPVAGGAIFRLKDTINVTFSPVPCSDGMSEIEYPFTVSARVNGNTLTGCGYARWDGQLAPLMPAIQACAAKARAGSAVTFAEPLADGGAFVALEAPEQDPQDCAVDAAGAVTVVDAERPPRASERDPLFYLAPGENPGGECYKAQEVRDAKGNLLGWIDTDQTEC